MSRSASVLALVGCLAASSVARGDTPPTAWDVARDPAAGERYRVHLRVEELRATASMSALRREKELSLESARVLLENASAATSPDVRLRFDLGEIYYDLERHQEAIDVLQPALAMAPRDGGSERAWLALAFSAAKLDRSRLELDAYDAYLAQSTNEGQMLNVLSNRAEGEMRLGHLDEAVAGYREVIARIEHSGILGSTEYITLVLARWGLAVALDRSGDPVESDQVAFVASEADPQERFIGDAVNVFFVPAYERDWYLALGRTQHARHALTPNVAFHHWSLVVQTWADYVGKAAKDDRWLPLAKAHLASAEVELRAAGSRLAAARTSRVGSAGLRLQLDPSLP